VKVYPLPVGGYQTNCYILSVEKRAVIVDPGDDANKIVAYLETNGLVPEAVLITHGHFDHLGALEQIQEKYPVDVYIHQDEKGCLTNPELNLSHQPGRGGISIKDLSRLQVIEEEGVIELLGEKIQTLHVPGHTVGSVVFYVLEAGFAIVGDVLFKSSIGRTDFPNGNHDQLIAGIKSKLMTLPEETIVYTGHGEATLIGTEKRNNPFL